MLLHKFETLQEKARRRYREEMARKEDEEANNTDTTRTRDLRTLAAADNVKIDQSRQVNAKDAFMLDLTHSSGQRLECRVEIIFRDNVKVPTDKGDILIRETGTRGRSWLLFPPIPKGYISSRRGERGDELIVMIRGVHNYRLWQELLTLTSDDQDQITDWLKILTSDPMPPTMQAHLEKLKKAAAAPSSPMRVETDIPVGARKLHKQPPSRDEAKAPITPSRYHKKNPSVVVTPPPTTPNSPDRTPTQDSYGRLSRQNDMLPPPFGEQVRPAKEPPKLAKQTPNSTPFRDDGAPPPPVHRTLGPKSPPSLSPPVDIGRLGPLKRRGSSPLKHEYHPSDMSSASSPTTTDGSDLSESGSESSSDELEDSDVPDLQPAISIKGKMISSPESVFSENSLTPSNSASMGGLVGAQPTVTEFSIKAAASISYWSNKLGTWKDVSTEACSVVITPGLIQAFALVGPHHTQEDGSDRPLIALDLTPLVLVRTSNSVDIEIRSPMRSYSVLSKIDAGIFRFRSMSIEDSAALYDAVHKGRMNNAKYKALEEEARFRSFGQQGMGSGDQSRSGDGSTSSRRRTWFGRKNSYRASNRAPSESQGSSSGVSASSFLKRLTGGGNRSFDIDRSTLDNRPGSMGANGGASPPRPGSLYSSSASSSARYGMSGRMRSPSISLADTGYSKDGAHPSPETGIPIRLYYRIPHSEKWEERGSCLLQILRPPPGMHQELQIYHGMEKRVKVTRPSNKEGVEDAVIIDVVLGSGCFSKLGSKGVVVKVWEDIRDTNGNVGQAPATGGVSGKMRTWCFQTKTAGEAAWVGSLLTQEVSLG
jgi:hypothetical protein